ncbi:MAG: Abi family protein [Bacteroidales bacterium]|nr:Abi family protein [Bacteroidales bacterium]
MARRTKIPYTKRATSYQQQITLLKSRGVQIADETKAFEYLSDIGYYRLGFYTYPFEQTYPFLDHRRSHNVLPGTTIEDIVAFYYYDLDLRNILNRYLSRIEVALRTTIIYELSNRYSSNPWWYVDPTIVDASFITTFTSRFYGNIKDKAPIKRHHHRYQEPYAPAWKAMEYMTLGNLENLYDKLLSTNDKSLISQKFGEPAIGIFKNYLSVIREVRNSCAHGNVIVDMGLASCVQSGAACPSLPIGSQNTFYGAIRVIDFMLRQISVNRSRDMWNEIRHATRVLYTKAPRLQPFVERKTGILLPSTTTEMAENTSTVHKIIKLIAHYLSNSKYNRSFVRQK